MLKVSKKLIAIVVFNSLFIIAFAQNKLVTTIPFEVVKGAIVLKVKINNSNKTLRLLFDTGADGMAVSKALADSIGLTITRSNNASVVGGNVKIEVSDGNNVVMENGFVLKNQGVAVFPKLDRGLDGLIGNAMTLRYVTKGDFNKNELSLYNFDNYEYEKGGTIVPVSIPQGLFIIPGNVEIVKGKSYKGDFVFDTGASYQLICFRPFVRQNKLLVSGFQSEYAASTVSMGTSSPTFNGKAASFSFANTAQLSNMPITLMAGGGQNESWNPGFDGSIGMGIITKYNFTINRKKNEIYLLPNHSYNYPLPFTLGKYLLKFNLNGELEIAGATNTVIEASDVLQVGTKIIAINGQLASTLIKDTKKLAAITSQPNQSDVKLKYTTNNNTNGEITISK